MQSYTANLSSCFISRHLKSTRCLHFALMCHPVVAPRPVFSTLPLSTNGHCQSTTFVFPDRPHGRLLSHTHSLPSVYSFDSEAGMVGLSTFSITTCSIPMHSTLPRMTLTPATFRTSSPRCLFRQSPHLCGSLPLQTWRSDHMAPPSGLTATQRTILIIATMVSDSRAVSSPG